MTHGCAAPEVDNPECCRFGIQVARSTDHANPKATNLVVTQDKAVQDLVAWDVHNIGKQDVVEERGVQENNVKEGSVLEDR